MTHDNFSLTPLPGDSGGPLILADAPANQLEQGSPENDELVGIVSFGRENCGVAGFAGVYTRVSSFHEWIKMSIEQSTSMEVGPFCITYWQECTG